MPAWIVAYAAIAVLTIYGLVLLLPARVRGHGLWWMGKRHRILFATDERGQLADGPEIWGILTTAATRVDRARAVRFLCLAVGLGFVVLGPTPSQSNVASIGGSVFLALAAVLPLLIVRPLFPPLVVAEDAERRPARTEDYVLPWLRALVWLGMVAALVLPVIAAVMATTDWYDARQVYWEHLILLPLACATAVLVLERWTHWIADVPDPDDPGLLCLWDSLRSDAIRAILGSLVAVLFFTFYGAGSIIAGVAFARSTGPAWVESLALVVLLAGPVIGVIGLSGTVKTRWWFRRRLWSEYQVDGLVPFGDARHAPRPLP